MEPGSPEALITEQWTEILKLQQTLLVLVDIMPIAKTNLGVASPLDMECLRGMASLENISKYRDQPPNKQGQWQCLRVLSLDGHKAKKSLVGDNGCETCRPIYRKDFCVQVKAEGEETCLRLVSLRTMSSIGLQSSTTPG
jgi:hypothetical protein